MRAKAASAVDRRREHQDGGALVCSFVRPDVSAGSRSLVVSTLRLSCATLADSGDNIFAAPAETRIDPNRPVSSQQCFWTPVSSQQQGS
jgi:hypothetical protein